MRIRCSDYKLTDSEHILAAERKMLPENFKSKYLDIGAYFRENI